MSADVAEVVLHSEDSANPDTITKPAGFASGQRLIFVLSQDSGLLADITLPSGWTAITGGTVDIASQRVKAAYHDFTGTEPSTWDFGYNSGASVAGVLLRITGADLATAPVCATSNTSSNTSSMTSPSVTPTGSDDLLICTYSNQGGAHTLAYTAPSGMTDLGSTQVVGGFQCLAAAKQLLVSGSATGTKAWTGLSPTGGAAATFSIAIKSATATASQTPGPMVVSPPNLSVPIPRAFLSSSLPLGNPAVPTPGLRVVSPQAVVVPVPGARLFAAPRQPAAPAPVVVSPPFSWPYIPPVTVSVSQPLGNPAPGTAGPLVVSTPWAARVPGALLFSGPAAPPVVTTSTPGPLVVTPPWRPVLVPTVYLSASLPLGNPAVPSPGPIVSTPTAGRAPVPGARLFAGAPGSQAPAVLVVSAAASASVPGAHLFAAPSTPAVAAVATPRPLVVAPPYATVRMQLPLLLRAPLDGGVSPQPTRNITLRAGLPAPRWTATLQSHTRRAALPAGRWQATVQLRVRRAQSPAGRWVVRDMGR